MESMCYVSDSVKGMERKENKDRVFVTEKNEHLLAVLFDGISSADEANKGIDIAVSFIEQNYEKLSLKSRYGLSDLMFDVNQKIIDSGLTSPFSTYSAVYISKPGDSATFSNLGDSRIYEVTPQYAKQLSQDDNLVNNKNVVTRYLGMVELDRSEIADSSLNITDKRMLLCSDGFYSLLEQNLSKFHRILNFKRPADIKKSLAQEIESKNQDDSSYILIF